MTIGNRPASARGDGRRPDELRPVTFTLGVQKWAEGSCRIRVGDTEVLCAATIADRIGLPGQAWQIQAKLADLHRARGDEAQAVQCQEQARAIGESLAQCIADETLRETFRRSTRYPSDAPPRR